MQRAKCSLEAGACEAIEFLDSGRAGSPNKAPRIQARHCSRTKGVKATVQLFSWEVTEEASEGIFPDGEVKKHRDRSFSVSVIDGEERRGNRPGAQTNTNAWRPRTTAHEQRLSQRITQIIEHGSWSGVNLLLLILKVRYSVG